MPDCFAPPPLTGVGGEGVATWPDSAHRKENRVERIDWFKLNGRSRQKYDTFIAALDSLGMALEDADQIVKAYSHAYDEHKPIGWGIVEPDELFDAAEDLTESLNSLVVKARKHEAKLKSWEWT